MSWRTDQAYDDAQRVDYNAWKSSLTWPQYIGVLVRSYRTMLAGAGVAGLGFAILWFFGR